MKRSLRGLALCCVALGVACGPVGPFAGGQLSGEAGSAQMGDWSAFDDEKVAQLETLPDDPHSINIWFAAIGPNLYVPTSMILGTTNPSERAWVGNVQADPRVRIRLAGTVFDRTAVRVEGAEYSDARAALERKYEEDPAEDDPERSIWIFRLEPRSG